MKQAGIRVLYVGLTGQFSLIPLRLLVAANIRPVAVVLPKQQVGSPKATIVQFCEDNELSLLFVGRIGGESAVSQIQSVRPDIALVSCFSQIIPQPVLDLPRWGFLNLHPSLLPLHRGPDPLFWAFHSGVLESGVTIHQMDMGLDSGDIVLQQHVKIAEGVSQAEAEVACATLGGGLFVDIVKQLANHHDASTFPLPVRPQRGVPSYESLPTMVDFGVDIGWSAKRAFIFMRGTVGWGYPYRLEIDGVVFWLKTAVSYHPNANELPVGTIRQQGNLHQIQFANGQLIAQLSAV